MNNIYDASSSALEFPSSLTGFCDHISLENVDQEIKVKDLIIKKPDFKNDELSELACKQRKLNETQFNSIKKHGAFAVESIQYPDHVHKWRLSSVLQIGSVNANKLLKKNLSTAWNIFIDSSTYLLLSSEFSIANGIKMVFASVLVVLDLLIGLPKDEKEFEYPFWRFKKFYPTIWADVKFIFYHFFIYMPLEGSMSLKALFASNEYVIENGKKQFIKVSTLLSTLRSLWIQVEDSRIKFELRPDDGLLDKSLIRRFHQIWNYLIRGVLGTISILIGMPLFFLSVIVMSIILGAIILISYPITSFLIRFFKLVIFDRPDQYFFSIFGATLDLLLTIFKFTRNLIVLFFSLIILLPVIGACTFIVTFAFIRIILRTIWDNFVFFVILKPFAKIPARNTYLANRYAGPDISLASSNFVYEIKLEQVLALVEIKLEVEQLKTYLSFIEKKVNDLPTANKEIFTKIIKTVNRGILNDNFVKIINDKKIFMETIRRLVVKRCNYLENLITNDKLTGKLRMNREDILKAIFESEILVKLHLSKSILPYKKLNNEISSEYKLNANYIFDYLQNLFGPTFFVPLNKNSEISFESKSCDSKLVAEYLKIIHNSKKNNSYGDLKIFEKYLK